MYESVQLGICRPKVSSPVREETPQRTARTIAQNQGHSQLRPSTSGQGLRTHGQPAHNFSHQLTHRLIEYPALCLENLSIIGLTKTKSAKSMLYAAFYQVLEIQVSLEWNYAFEADRFFPSTLCSHCGYQNKNLRLSDREWSCAECKVKHRKDHNAQNLQSRGYSTTCR
jgi:transposase